MRNTKKTHRVNIKGLFKLLAFIGVLNLLGYSFSYVIPQLDALGAGIFTFFFTTSFLGCNMLFYVCKNWAPISKESDSANAVQVNKT